MINLKFKKNTSGPYLLIVFCISNALLSYSSFGLQSKILIIIVGLILPFYLTIRFNFQINSNEPILPNNSGTPLYSMPFFFLFSILAILLRFYCLEEFHSWPSGDEGLQGYFAIDLIQNWNWRFFYTTGQHPPLLIWLLRGFFQNFESPFFNIWFLPAFLSTFFVLLSYWTARLFFSRNVSSIYFMLMALSFWPMFFGRFCVQGVLIPILETTAILLLGYFLNASKRLNINLFACCLGLCAGLGTWAYTSWFSVVFFLIVVFFASEKQKRIKKAIPIGLFSICLLLSSLPWIISAVDEKFGGYVVGVSLFSGYFDWKEQLINSASYFTCLFWGAIKSPAAYGPVWGGMLNPLLDSFFFIGCISVYKTYKKILFKPFALALILFILPGILSADHVEMFRVIQLLPVVMILVSIGMIHFLEFIPSPQKSIFVLLIILISFSLDLIHLFKSSDLSFLSFKSAKQVQDENYWAYQKFKTTAEKWGPGMIFTDFILLDHDHTLNLASYHFNVLTNSKYNLTDARWAGIVTNVHYVPFLSKRFSGSQWFKITPNPVEDGGTVVGLIYLNPQNRGIFSSWAMVHQYFHQLGINAENDMNDKKKYLLTIENLNKGLSLLRSDPFLEVIYGEWVAQYHFGSDFGPNIRAIQRAIQKGYPTANLYYKLGNFYLINQQKDEALKAYSIAVHCKPNYTNVEQAISYLGNRP